MLNLKENKSMLTEDNTSRQCQQEIILKDIEHHEKKVENLKIQVRYNITIF